MIQNAILTSLQSRLHFSRGTWKNIVGAGVGGGGGGADVAIDK